MSKHNRNASGLEVQNKFLTDVVRGASSTLDLDDVVEFKDIDGYTKTGRIGWIQFTEGVDDESIPHYRIRMSDGRLTKYIDRSHITRKIIGD